MRANISRSISSPENIFDTHYYNNALNLGPGYGGSLILQPGDPVTFGVAATARF